MEIVVFNIEVDKTGPEDLGITLDVRDDGLPVPGRMLLVDVVFKLLWPSKLDDSVFVPVVGRSDDK